jgi:uncharacterized protein YkwD
MPRIALFVVALLCLLRVLVSAPAGAVAAGDCTLTASQEMLDAEERAFLTLINAHRAASGVPPLTASYRLTRAAQWKSIDLGTNAYFAHDDLSRTWTQRINDCGYTYGTWLGENIMAGSSTAQGAFDAWKNSPGHNANMLSANYTAIGIGRAYVPGSPYSWYWTTDFGGVNDGWAFATDAPPAPDGGGDASAGVAVTVEEGRGAWRVHAFPDDPTTVALVEFYVNGKLARRDRSAPYTATLRAPHQPDAANITVRVVREGGTVPRRR